MKIVLDESLPMRLKEMLPGHEVRTLMELGCAGVRNVDLMKIVAAQSDVFITTARNLAPMQGATAGMKLMIVVLEARSNRTGALNPLAEKLRAALEVPMPGKSVRIGA